MLTLKEPIKLNTCSAMLTMSDAFCEKLMANYELMQAQLTPKELLLLLATPIELPETQPGMTSLAVSNSVQNSKTVNLDIINNVVNRIILAEQTAFTYQDQVYITSVLQKLGVTDVSEFMRQVKNLSEDNRNIFRLTRLYEENSDKLTQVFQQIGERARENSRAADENVGLPEIRYFIQNEIYSRLETAELYNFVNAYQRNQTIGVNILNNSELKLAEQVRVGGSLSLSEQKRQYFGGESVTMQHHLNHYELGDIVPEPQTEDQVMSQAAAAILLNVIDNVITSSLKRAVANNFWLDIRNVLSASAENSLSRFEMYHGEYQTTNRQTDYYAEEINALRREEYIQVTRLLQLFEFGGDETRLLPETALSRTENVRLEYRRDGDEVDSSVHSTSELSETKQFLTNEQFSSLTQSILSGGAAAPNKKAAKRKAKTDPKKAKHGDEAAELSVRQTDHLMTIEQLNSSQRFLELLQQQISQLNTSDVALAIQQNFRSQLSDVLYSRRTENAYQTNLAFHKNDYYAESGDIINYNEPPASEAADKPVSPQTSPAETTRQLHRQLSVINERNREVFEKVRTEAAQRKNADTPRTPDRKRIREQAFKALENPEQVVAELLGTPPEIRRGTEENVTKVLLSIADDDTRRIFDALAQYSQNPQAAIDAGLVRPAGAAELNAEATSSVAEHKTALIQLAEEHVEDTRIIRDTLETVVGTVSKQFRASEIQDGPFRSSVPIVHRQTETTDSDELIERMELRRQEKVTQQTESSSVTHETVSQTEINNVKQKLIETTTEDITELVNRTLARQVGAITDRVYSQMEKRLQSERARRGRF